MKNAKTFILFLFLCIATSVLRAQVPFAFNYQGVASSGGNALANQEIALRISLVQSFSEGTVVFAEEHVTTTNDNGLFTIRIGEGIPILGNLRAIDWGGDDFFIRTELDPSGGEDYSDLGTTPLYSVPYALFAAESANGGSDGGGTDDQTLTLSGTTLSIENGNSVNLSSIRDGVNDADADPNNEIQSLSISGNILSLSGSNSVTLPS